MESQEVISRISIARTRAKLSARALSTKIEMNEGYINRLESKQDFLPSLDVLLKIIEECGLTPEQFFYYDMDEFEKDKELIYLLKNVNKEKKEAIITLLKN